MKLKFLYFFIFISITPFSQSKQLSDEQLRSRFQLVAEPACKKVKFREPELPVNSVWYGRYYLSVDGKKECQILDVRIDWLTDGPNEFRKYLNTILYRFNGKIWMENRALNYPPKYRIYDKNRKIVYLVIRNNERDFPVDEVAYYTGTWDEERNGERAIEKLWLCEKNQNCYDEYMNVKRAVFLLNPEK